MMRRLLLLLLLRLSVFPSDVNTQGPTTRQLAGTPPPVHPLHTPTTAACNSLIPTDDKYVRLCMICVISHRRRWLRKLGAGSCNSPSDSWQFSTEEITDAQNFNFAPKFFQSGRFSAPFFHFWK